MIERITEAIKLLAVILLPLATVVVYSWWTADVGVFNYHDQRTAAEYYKHEQYCDRVAIAFGSKVPPNSPGQQPAENPHKNQYDSCQQWRTAEANEKAAFWAKVQGLAATLGLILVVAATYFAGRAFGEARRQANSATDQVAIMREERGPRLHVEPMQITRSVITGDANTRRIWLHVRSIIHNTGTTPTGDAEMMLSAHWSDDFDRNAFLSGNLPVQFGFWAPVGLVVPAFRHEDTRPCSMWTRGAVDQIDIIIIATQLRYRHGGAERTTRQFFSVGIRDEEGEWTPLSISDYEAAAEGWRTATFRPLGGHAD